MAAPSGGRRMAPFPAEMAGRRIGGNGSARTLERLYTSDWVKVRPDLYPELLLLHFQPLSSLCAPQSIRPSSSSSFYYYVPRFLPFGLFHLNPLRSIRSYYIAVVVFVSRYYTSLHSTLTSILFGSVCPLINLLSLPLF